MTRKTSGHVQYRHNFFSIMFNSPLIENVESTGTKRWQSQRPFSSEPGKYSRQSFPVYLYQHPSLPFCAYPTLCSKLPELPRTPRKASSCFSLPGNFLALVLTFLALIFHEMSWVQIIILFSFVPDGWGFCLLLPQKLPRDTGKLASQAPGSTCPAMEAELGHKQG